MKIRELLSSPDKLAKGSFARDKNGNTCPADSPNAASWCLVGARMRCYGYTTDSTAEEAREIDRKIMEALPEQFASISLFNDNSTYDEVKALVDQLDI